MYERAGGVPLTNWRARGAHQLDVAWMALCNTHANSREAARLNTAGCKLNVWVWTPRLQDDASSHVPVDRCGAAVREASKGPARMDKTVCE